MKCIATYPGYDLANSRQVDLLAAEIDARVWYVPNGVDQVYFGALPIYALTVPPEDVERALQIISVYPDETHACIYACPHCGSGRVIEVSMESTVLGRWWMIAISLGIAGFLAMLWMRLLGRLYVCEDCRKRYRKKP